MAKSKSEVIQPTKEQIIKGVKNINSGGSSTRAGFMLAKSLYATPEKQPTFQDADIWTEAIRSQTDELNAGDFSCLVGRLNGQMVLMESLFIKTLLLTDGSTNVDHINKLGTLAMKLQSNIRNTAQTICDLKHPRQQVNFVKAETANLSNGPQQNNITHQSGVNYTHGGEAIEANELLESSHPTRFRN